MNRYHTKWKVIILMFIGILTGFYLSKSFRNHLFNCSRQSCLKILANDQLKFIAKNRRLIYVGVLSENKTFALEKSSEFFPVWNENIQGRVDFYSKSKWSDHNKVSFLMVVEHMHEFFQNDFEWFVLVKEDFFIRTDKFQEFLKSYKSSEHFLFSLNNNVSCLKDFAAVMSSQTLKIIRSHLKNCPKNFSDRKGCIQKILNISCTITKKQISKTLDSFDLEYLSKAKIQNLIVLSGLKKPRDHFLILNYFTFDKLTKLNRKRFEIESALNKSEKRKIPFDLNNLEFEIFNSKDIYPSRKEIPRHTLEKHWKNTYNSVLAQTDQFLSENCTQLSKNLNYGYLRHNAKSGYDLILSIQVNCTNYNKNMSLVGNKNFYIKNKFTNLIFDHKIDLLYESEYTKNTINIVLPVYERWESFRRFILNYEDICLKQDQNTRLTVVLFESKSNKTIWIKNLFETLRLKYSKNLNDSSFRMLVSESEFTRSKARNLGAEAHDFNDLLFFVDVDVVFSKDVLLRIRLNTIQHKQVYFPIVFSEYNPKNRVNNASLSVDSGYWRFFGFGMIGAYKSDFKQIGGFNNKILGWGKEDFQIYQRFIYSNLSVFRAADPGLVHVYHSFECGQNLTKDQFKMCYNSNSATTASQRVLANLFYAKRNL